MAENSRFAGVSALRAAPEHDGKKHSGAAEDAIEDFSLEFGDVASVLKACFCALSPDEVESLAKEYGEKYGPQAEDAAREAFADWRANRREMGGLAAKRLLELLPPRLTAAARYDLIEALWRHFGPASHAHFGVTPTSDIGELLQAVSQKFDAVALAYNIPEEVKDKFKWLHSAETAAVERLLNHFRQQEKALALETIRLELPVLQRQRMEYPDTSLLLRLSVQVHRHRISIDVQ